MSRKKDSQWQDGLRVEQWPIDRLIPYARNPRRNDEQVERMASAIREFGFRIPIVAKSDGTVVDGHLRLKAAQKLGLKEVPVALADELTEAQVKAFRLLANKSANWAEWDDELLKLELEDLQCMDFDLALTGFEAGELADLWLGSNANGGENVSAQEDEKYSVNIKTPIYEPTGEAVEIEDCFDDKKYQQLVNEINRSDISEDVKSFLLLAATRHIVFNYEKIANMYANANKEIQELMENSALIIIDYEKAIEGGFVEFHKNMERFKSSDMEYTGGEDD